VVDHLAELVAEWSAGDSERQFQALVGEVVFVPFLAAGFWELPLEEFVESAVREFVVQIAVFLKR